MRIERINENQIRCFLTRKDLESRNLSVKELASGGIRTSEFFNEMMHEALDKVNFDAEGSSLSIEATQTTPDDIIITITKVDNPANDFIKMFNKLISLAAKAPEESSDSKKNVNKASSIKRPYRVYVFNSIAEVKKALKILSSVFDGVIYIYLNKSNNLYYCLVEQGITTADYFNKICNIMSEYGEQVNVECMSKAYYEEHFDKIYQGNVAFFKE